LKTGKIGSGRLSKSTSWPWLSKALGVAPRNPLFNRSKGFELAGFKKLFENSKAFCAKQLRINLFNIKSKRQFKKL
jgi:hypothetical protein